MKKFLALTLFVNLLFSCSSNDNNFDDIEDVVNYSTSVFVTNEGNFMSANASISAINNSITSISNTIFKTANSVSVGDVAQSMAFFNGMAFIVVNNSNVIEVVTKNDFKRVATISDNLSGPRYSTVKNNLLYVTNSNNTIAIFNAKTFEFIKKINLTFTPEFIIDLNDKLYVSSNFYDAKSELAIVNTTTNSIEESLNFTLPINGLTSDAANVYVLTTSSQKTVLHTISGLVLQAEKEFAITDSRFLTFDQNQLYFTSNYGVYSIATIKLNQANAQPVELFKVESNSWSSLYGFEVFNGNIFTSDAKGFTEDSKITIYNTNGTKVASFTAGIGANGFYKD